MNKLDAGAHNEGAGLEREGGADAQARREEGVALRAVRTAVGRPAVLTPHGPLQNADAPASDAAPRSAAARNADPDAREAAVPRGLVARIRRLFSRGPAREKPAGASDAASDSASVVLPDATVRPAPSARLCELPRLAGQDSRASYALLRDDALLPPGGAAYVVSYAAPSADPAPDASPAAGCDPRPEPLASTPACTVVAYVDAFGRAFSAGGVLSAPPARVPDVRLARYAEPRSCTGYIEVVVAKGKTARLAEYAEGESGLVRIVAPRVDFGTDLADLDPVEACAVSFLALWLFPRKAGVSLGSMSVRDALAHLRAPGLFEAIDLFLADVRQSEAHPLLQPPGLVVYAAANLRAAGLEGLDPSELAPRVGRGDSLAAVDVASLLDGLPFAVGAPDGAAPGSQAAAPAASEPPSPAPGTLIDSIRRALEASGIAGVTFLAAGAAGDAGAPSVRLVRAGAHANMFHVAFDRNQVSADGARRLLEAESILNRFALMVEELDRVGAVQTATWGQVAGLDAWLVDGIGRLADPYLDATVEGFERPQTQSADLDARIAFARGCELLRLPMRLEYGYRFDASCASLVVDVECPSSALMPWIVALDDATPFSQEDAGSSWRARSYAEREVLATRYALHLAVLMAAVGFWAQGCVSYVTVNCWHGTGSSRGVDELAPLGAGMVRGPVMGEPACVASLRFERAAFAAALADERQRAAFRDDPLSFAERVCRPEGAAGNAHGMPAAGPCACRLQLDDDAHLCRVEPLRDLGDCAPRPDAAPRRPDLDARPFDDRARELLGVSRICDMAIYEQAARDAVADEIADAFELEGREAALAAARDAHDRTENPLMRQACLRVAEGIESGMLTRQSRRQITEALVDVYGLQAGMRRVHGMLPDDAAGACRQLDRMLAELDERVVFADTDTRRYRYFDSYASRALYGMRLPEARDGRELRLVADEYYLCHYRLATMLSESLDHAEDAIAHARRCVELGPSVAASYLRLARCYFSVFDYLSEIDVLRDMLRIAWNPGDVGLALYWLGYAFCLVDKPEAGMACYQTSAEYDANLMEVAATEAAEYMRRKGSGLPKGYPEARRMELLAAEGIDLGQVRRNVDDVLRAAGAAVDAGSYALARDLIGAAGTALRDESLAPVEESLEE